MGPVRAVVCLIAIGALLLAAGCGSSGSGSTGTSTGPVPVLQRGIKGEDPTIELATDLHLSAADCAALGRLAEGRLGRHLKRASKPTPPLSKCHLQGPGAQVNVYLDTAHGANQRYTNRIVETVQFNAQHPAGLPRPVPHVGEKSYLDSAASWIPALGSLLAVRGNRWLTVTIAVEGFSGRRLRAEAATLARAGFKLSATG